MAKVLICVPAQISHDVIVLGTNPADGINLSCVHPSGDSCCVSLYLLLFASKVTLSNLSKNSKV